MAVPLVLDTDIGTDVDDALALAFALRHPDIELRAVTTVSGDAVRRARIATALVRLGGGQDVEVAAGASYGAIDGGPPPEMGHEGEGLDLDEVPVSERSALEVLLDQSVVDGKTTVATVGMQTNVAAAVDADAAWASRVGSLAVMGGVFAPLHFLDLVLPPERDHNLNVDPAASQRALSAGCPTLYVPCDVTFGAWLEQRHVDALRQGDALCRELARQIDGWADLLRQWLPLPDGLAVLLHDPLTVACAVDRSCVTVERLPVTVAQVGRAVRTFIDPVAGVDADVVRSVDAPAFADLWTETVLGRA